VIKRLLSLIFSVETPEKSKVIKNEPLVPEIEFDEKIKASILVDWDIRFPISGEPNACKRFKGIIGQSILTGNRVEGNNLELLQMLESGSVVIESIAEFQRHAVGKYKIVNRKAIITDDTLDEIPYGTLSSLLKNNPKACLKAFEVGVSNYAMTKYHVSRYLASGVRKASLSSVPKGSRRCKRDSGRIVILDPNALIVPHYLGCACYIRPIIKFDE
jgi:hypothetical protein